MPGPGLQYPPDAATVSGSKITVDRWLKNPTIQQKSFERITLQQGFVADFLFRGGLAEGGAVIYDKLTAANLWADGEPGLIAPMSEFPLVDVSDPDPKIALAVERGLAFETSFQAIRRNNMDVIAKGVRRLANTMIRNHDAVALNTFYTDADIPAGDGSVTWATDGGDGILTDMFAGSAVVEDGDLAYTVDTAIIRPETRTLLLSKKAIRDALPRENTAINPVTSGKLSGLAGIDNWIVSKRAPVGKVAYVNSKVVGSINVEEAFWTASIEDKLRRRWVTQAGRSDVPIIDEPLAAYIQDIL